MRTSATSILLLGLLIVCTLVYWPGRSGGFVFDDYPNIVDNPELRITSLDAKNLKQAGFSAPTQGPAGRPLSMLSFGINHVYSGLSPQPYKLTNIAIHLLATIAVFFLTRAIFRALAEVRGIETNEKWAVLAVTAIFALHPMQLTSVLYVVQRMTSLAGLFTLLGLWAYVEARRRMLRGEGGLTLLVAGPIGFAGIAVLAKENGALLPLFATAIEATVFRFRTESDQLDRRVVLWHGLFSLLPIAVAGAWLLAEPQRFLSAYTVRDYSLIERVLTESRVLIFYLKNLIAPSLSDLSLYHDDIAISTGLLMPVTTLVSIVALVGLGVLAFLMRARSPLVTLGILWFFVGHLMESTLLPLEIAHEHRNYLPTYGFALAVVGAVTMLRPVHLTYAMRSVALCAFITMLGLVTGMRATHWSDPYGWADMEVRNHPNSPRATHEAGRLYATLALKGNVEAREPALSYLTRSAALDGSNPMPEATMVIMSAKLGLPIQDAWLASMMTKFGERPLSPAAVTSLKQLVRCTHTDRCLSDPAIAGLLEAAYRNETLRFSPRRLADIATLYGEYFINVHGDYAAGETKFREAIALAPEIAQFRVNLVNLMLAMGRADEATTEIDSLKAIGTASDRKITVLTQDVTRLRTFLATQP
jgi:hypothetical protein